MKPLIRRAGMLLASILVIAAAYSFGRFEERSRSSVARAESSKQASAKAVARATRALPDRDAYFPNTEDLGPDEIRIIACGTGMPSARESQAASCFLVELGNGDKFIFDGGTGSDARIGSLEIPYDLLDKIFISHLHTDHWGSFPAYYVGGWVAGRTVPLRVWGPSGSRPELGTAYAMEHLKKAYTWDIEGRTGRLPPEGGKLEVHEFDWKAIQKVIYQENGVTIRSFPQIHSLDGSVGFTLEWNPHLTRGFRENHEPREAANGRWLPLLQRLRYGDGRRDGHPLDLRRAAVSSG